MKSWKTTASALVVIIAVILKTFFPEQEAALDQAIAWASAAGLLAARDNNVTSEQAGASNLKRLR